jgi:hypothetical protein
VHALFDLTKKDTPFMWGAAEEEAFASLKNAVTSSLTLVMPDHDRPYRLEPDGSGIATGAVLSQLCPDNTWQPVVFLSKSLTPVERNYEIHDTEMLAILRALKEWRHYLEPPRTSPNHLQAQHHPPTLSGRHLPLVKGLCTIKRTYNQRRRWMAPAMLTQACTLGVFWW